MGGQNYAKARGSNVVRRIRSSRGPRNKANVDADGVLVTILDFNSSCGHVLFCLHLGPIHT